MLTFFQKCVILYTKIILQTVCLQMSCLDSLIFSQLTRRCSRAEAGKPVPERHTC